MKLKKLLRKNIEPRCAYCVNGSLMADGERVTCLRHGVVDSSHSCGAFRYDPLRRVPPKPAAIRGHFTDADFSMEDSV